MPFYFQNDHMDCGPACIKMVAKYYGRDFSLQFLREKAGIGKTGVSLLGISEAAEVIGFRTKALKLTASQLSRNISFPCILHWNQNHFVVLYKVRKEGFYIGDPAVGVSRLSRAQFLSCWISDVHEGEGEGVALALSPSPGFYNSETEDGDLVKGQQDRMSFKSIFYYLFPYKRLVIQLLLGLGASALLQLVVPFLARSIVDVGINTVNIHFIYVVLFGQLALFAGRLAMDFLRGWILLHISTRINISILTDFLIKLMKLPFSFFDSKVTGDILQRMNDHRRIESFLTGSSINVLFSLFNLFIFSIVLALFNFQIFFVFLVAAALYSAWVTLFMRQRRRLDYRQFTVGAKEQGATIQMIQGMQEIKLNGIERSMRWRWEAIQARLFNLTRQGLMLNQWQTGGAFFINEGKNIFITFLSAKAVIDGQITMGTMLAIQYIIGQLNSPVDQVISFVQSWQNAKISMERLNEIHQLEDEEPASMNLLQELPAAFAGRLSGGRGGVTEPLLSYEAPIWELPSPTFSGGDGLRFRNVVFAYPGEEPVIKGIDLHIPEGKITAIVGLSGSGKTTLLKLLLRFYDPQKGDILFDGVYLRHISHRVWRGRCGVVMQESYIFSDTIARNIAPGTEEIDLVRLENAIGVANAQDFIRELPMGYNTRIGADGSGVSMGQRQRILIARAVYRNPDFIFFDEATNSLDANNESTIIRNLGVFFKGKTVVIVAHRLSTVKDADQIVILNRGVVAEQGTHAELVSKKGEYFTLVRNQLDIRD